MSTATISPEAVREHLRRCLPQGPWQEPATTRLRELGLDSIDTVELLCVVHEEWGVRLQEAELHAEQTLGGLLAAITQHLETTKP